MNKQTRANGVAWKFQLSTEESWQEMLAAIAAAKHTIDLEQFILADDAVGRQFVALLMAKSRAGVKVRLLLDVIGSQSAFVSPTIFEIAKAGVEIVFFNPIEPWWLHKLVQWFLRDHRKLLIVDGAVGITGGVGIEAAMAGWRDTNVSVTGPVVGDMQRSFERMWQMAKAGKRFSRDWKRLPAAADFSFLTNSPAFRQRYIYRSLLSAIRGARKYIYLTTPYFIPDNKLFDAFKVAQKRGVDIRLIVPMTSDHWFVDLASRSYYRSALRAGVKLYLFQDRIIHAKTAVVDDRWATVGSANLDNISMLLNYEGNIVSTNPQFIAEVKEQFLRDQEHSKELQKKEWVERPFIQKFFELLTYPLHRLM